MTGYTADEVLGRNCRFLQGEETDPAAIDELRRAIAEQRATIVHLRNYKKDGTPFWNEVHIAPVRNDAGEVERFVGVQIDVSAYREPERRSSFLADAGPLLDASLDLDSTLASLTRLSIPFLGDVCVVDEVRHDEVRRLSCAARLPDIERRVRELPNPFRAREENPVVRVVHSGRAEIVEDERLFGQHANAMVVPLKARGNVMGAVLFASLSEARDYTPQDLVVAEDLALRAAL